MKLSARLFRPTRALLARARQGFALIVTLSLMTLLLLLVLTLTTLVRINLQTANANLLSAEARENALFAAYVAIGQLQKFAGPDQRVTTTADLGRTNDPNDHTADDQNTMGAPVYSNTTLTPTPVPVPFGQSATFTTGGTRFWTAVWGNGVNPLAIYTGLGADYSGASSPGPMPILMNWLVSGNENTPIYVNAQNGYVVTNGVVTKPDGIAYTADTGDPAHGVTSPTVTDQQNWTALTNDITISPKYGDLAAKPAIVLVGPNSAYTSNPVSVQINSANGNNIVKFNTQVGIIVAPLVPINTATLDGASTFTSGRYAYWVGDEGVKAKYNPVDPYVGNVTANTTTANGQLSRYRFYAAMRTGIERMMGFNPKPAGAEPDPNTLLNSPITTNSTVGALLNRVTQPNQILLAEQDLTGIGNDGIGRDKAHPEQTIQIHFHDITTYSYGLLTDTLRSGLRYDLTTAFEPNSSGTVSQVFTDTVNGLRGKTFLPVTTGSAATTSTEPNVVSGGGATAAQLKLNLPGGVNFHGPFAGLKWDMLQSYYMLGLPSKLITVNGVQAVQMQAGSTTVAGVSPVILEHRLAFGQFSETSREQYVSVEPIFVLANPYNFPITSPPGGLDLGYRINTDTKWEWGMGLVARNADRRKAGDPAGPGQGSGAGICIGYDTTQNDLSTQPNSKLDGHYGFAYLSSSLGSGNSLKPGYYAILKNPVSFTSFHLGPTPALNTQYNSVLDQVAFHIKAGPDATFMPGEAKLFILGGGNLSGNLPVPSQGSGPAPFNPMINGPTPTEIHAIVGTANTTNPANTFSSGQIAPVLLTPTSFSSVHRIMVRDIGVSVAGGKAFLNPNPGFAFSPMANETTNNPWPDPKYGYISSAYPTVAATLELRYDTNELFPGSGTSTTILPSGSVNGAGPVQDVKPITTTVASTTGSGIAGPGQNVLQSITNFDLTGAGVGGGAFSDTNPNASNYMPPGDPNNTNYRRQYIGTTDSSLPGSLPAFLFSFSMAMSLPGNMGQGIEFYTNKSGSVGTGIFDTGNIVSNVTGPSVPVAFSIFKDYNLRATNMVLPPFAHFNTAIASTAITSNPAVDFQSMPPYGRVYDQGPGDDAVITSTQGNHINEDTLGSISGGGNDMPWGYSLGNGTFNGTKSGLQFVALYGIPQRNSSTITLNGVNFPNVPIFSIGQLQHADVTQDDVWASVSYEPGNAIGNSYFTPYVSRISTVQPHTNQSATTVWTNVANNSGGKGTLAKNSSAPANANANAYDISYLMNTVLWDRYFFSTLTNDSGPNSGPLPANSRLKYVAGYNPDKTTQLGLGQFSTTLVTDPATGLQMFKAYAPARFMMVDGAFNVNSTSFDAWRAVLSGLRGVPFSNGKNDNAANPAVYFPRFPPSNSLSTAQSTGIKVNSPYDPTDSTGGSNYTNGGTNALSFAGFRMLTDAEIDSLAAKIVQMVHQRGPFLSLAQFVNRRLDAVSGTNVPMTSVSGPLQAAIDLSMEKGIFPSLNNFRTYTSANMSAYWAPGNGAANISGMYPDGSVAVAPLLLATDSSTYNPSNPYKNFPPPPLNPGTTPLSADPTSRVAGIPGWLTQADILQVLGPILSVRSDTFLIRTYGEVLSPELPQNPATLATTITNDPTSILSRAWCELVVQRMPDYVATDKLSINDPSTTTGYGAPNPAATINAGNNAVLSPVNANFGRRFKVVSIRWLTANDI